MKNAAGHYETYNLPMWVYAIIHLTWWSIGMVVVTVMYPLVLLAERREPKSREGQQKETKMKGQVVV
jgi:hypothetical protein